MVGIPILTSVTFLLRPLSSNLAQTNMDPKGLVKSLLLGPPLGFQVHPGRQPLGPPDMLEVTRSPARQPKAQPTGGL